MNYLEHSSNWEQSLHIPVSVWSPGQYDISTLTHADADIMIVKVQMTVYGHAISYGTIGTVVAGILAAFASKILLQEISGIWSINLKNHFSHKGFIGRQTKCFMTMI